MIYAELSHWFPQGQFSDQKSIRFSSQFCYLSQPNPSFPELHLSLKPEEVEAA